MQHDEKRKTKAEDNDGYQKVRVGQNGFCLGHSHAFPLDRPGLRW